MYFCLCMFVLLGAASTRHSLPSHCHAHVSHHNIISLSICHFVDLYFYMLYRECECMYIGEEYFVKVLCSSYHPEIPNPYHPNPPTYKTTSNVLTSRFKGPLKETSWPLRGLGNLIPEPQIQALPHRSTTVFTSCMNQIWSPLKTTIISPREMKWFHQVKIIFLFCGIWSCRAQYLFNPIIVPSCHPPSQCFLHQLV